MTKCDCSQASLDGMIADAAKRSVASAVDDVVTKARKKHVGAALSDSADAGEKGRRASSVQFVRDRVDLPPDDNEKLGKKAAEELVRFAHSDEGVQAIEAGRLV